MVDLKIRKTEAYAIELHGIAGSFRTPGANYHIKYFCSFASAKRKGEGPHLLLQELKPMRERINPSEVKDLGSLLQRDLNDSRIANELVPYLLGQKGGVAFFPAVLAVLIPKDFLNAANLNYPSVHRTQDSCVYSIDDTPLWELELSSGTPLGILKFYPDRSDVVVLDGQHRSNAFRVVTGDFFDDRKAMLYEPFYKKPELDRLKSGVDFDADLPVTLIWFESDKDNAIEPTVISRKLFVDVNNTAQSVSESRSILLNDYDPASVLTRMLYSTLARTSGFIPHSISLLHSGFDIDSDLRYSKPHVFTLTTPQLIHYVMDWVFFGTRYHRRLDVYSVQRESRRIDTTPCKSLMPVFGRAVRIMGMEESSKYFDMDNTIFSTIEDEFNRTTGTIFQKILNEFTLCRLHFDACKKLVDKRDSWGSMIKKEVLDRVFLGGEGLYYAYKSEPHTTVSQVADIKNAIAEIENDFLQERKTLLGSDFELKTIATAFEAFRTKAFQVGMFMAFYHYYDHRNSHGSVDLGDVVNDFLSRLNRLSAGNWIRILSDMRPMLIQGTDPKKWPAYHKVIMRVLEQETEFFNNEDQKNFSPEVKIFENRVEKKFDGWCESNNIVITTTNLDQIDESVRKDWFTSAENEIYDVFQKCGITPIKTDYFQVGNRKIEDVLKKKASIVDDEYE